MKKISMLLLTLFMGVMIVGCDDKDDAVTHIGVIQYAEHPALDQAYEGFLAALKDEGYKEGDNLAIDFKNAQGDPSTPETIANKLVNDQNDLIYAIATPAAQAVAQKTSEIPVVISAVTDPKSSGLVKNNKKPGTNVTGTSDLTPVNEQIDLLTQLLPDAKKVAIMYTNAEDNSRFQADLAKKAIEKAGLEWSEAKVSDMSQIQQVTQSLVGKVDAIYIPTDNMMAEGMSTVSMVANKNNIPCIVGEGGMVKNGGLATYGINYYNLGYQAGLQAAKILKGENPADMPIEYLAAEDCELTINTTVAKELGITIPQELKDKATLVE
ncbi:putative ABC transport system substrate-binding protein [Breznakia sp. PF5-3]|uniref:ABC transporter substrate-binding protein n=1 Tax=unclassified Breznakia TaxID=2623764 RepID=UPI002405E67C|nr:MULTISPECIES: ABC transporter substrate-binding protein [unclassified Breznakia]MDL2276931.1 ABC transporter substrate-binding protein [Breznakia sp. OttesenSCG-928-G09]MDF9824640.1 putative ABC transport system substrate-binding protein [Breznakia sp. PM6-1]MDF9835625.1 putative ABC transport system substrate-binding protein [Breznakia sp. PF5-3]MDF9837710.1 putative ABC transport system substrate-binding protein [Breznakia sp. PFB2-8]MDF9859574.1 putative ABC transport system substrate-bi